MDDYALQSGHTQHHAFDIAAMEKLRIAANYLAAAHIYLQDNPLPEAPLKPEHFKLKLLGHWGTSPPPLPAPART